jgi:hypothetical protein
MGSVDLPSTRQSPMNACRLNYPSVEKGGAREGQKGEGDPDCEWTRGVTTGVATRLTTVVGTDATGPLCDIIWQDQVQRGE